MNGYDHCGSTCEEKFTHTSSDADLQKCYNSRTEFGPHSKITWDGHRAKRICTDDCAKGGGSYETFFNRCLPDKQTASKIVQLKYYLVEVSEDLELYWKQLMHLCFLSLALSCSVILLFRYCVGYIVWIILIGVQIACVGASIALWTLWIRRYIDDEIYDEERKLWLHLGCAIGATIITIIVGLIILCMRKKIELVVQLFKEAGKAIADIPELMLEPVLTFLAFLVTISCWVYVCLWISSSGHLTKHAKVADEFYYKKDKLMMATAILNTLGMFWIILFIVGCQHMIVAGSVSKWYFTREKSKLSSPLIESAYNLTRYHLGSVALGSFLIVIIRVLRLIVNIIKRLANKERNNWLMCAIRACLCLCSSCLGCLDWIVSHFTGNAYIITAMYGHSFCKAGKQAFARISAHPLSFAAINSVGDFVLFLAKVLVFVVTEASALYLLKGKGVQHMWVFLALVGLFSITIVHCFVTVYEMTIDTIFICFCEDSEMNDGISKPYYMSRGLMEYVDNSKKALKMHDKKKIFENRQLKGNEIRTVSLDLDAKNNSKI